MSWRDKSACRDNADPDLWFPDDDTPQDRIDQALNVCARCPVLGWCDKTLAEYGIWGGKVREMGPSEAEG